MWFSESTGHMLGAWLGASAGVLMGTHGALTGLLLPRGKGKRVVLSAILVFLAAGTLSLGTGLYALLTGQPYHVWYPFMLVGGILLLVEGPAWFGVRTLYRQVELDRMARK
ncbi:MAG TPA: hypothetical protein VLK32_07120, partial [Bacillota bacterium]|nr:hypothetical protein [Bacillota bacterium]